MSDLKFHLKVFLLVANFVRNLRFKFSGKMTDVITSFDQQTSSRRRDGSTATYHSTSSFDLNNHDMGVGASASNITMNTGTSQTNIDGIEVHDVGTSTPGVKQNFSAQADCPTSVQPKYEAFVMTGDKILNLSTKISPNYAKVSISYQSSTFVYKQTGPTSTAPAQHGG